MRKAECAITDVEEVFAVVKRCQVLHLAMAEQGRPYVVPLNFGYDREGDRLILYMHSAAEGKKMDILRKNPEAAFVMEQESGMTKRVPDSPCSYAWQFDSIMGRGRIEFLTGEAEKTYALNRIVQHLDQTEKSYQYSEQSLAGTCVYRLAVEELSGKHRG